MRHERTPTPAPGHRPPKRCPACQQIKPAAAFYATTRGRPSGYCKTCQRTVSRRSRSRRTAAVRLLIALHPEEWAAALRQVDAAGPTGEGGDAA
jgi:hypothetical protein